VKYLDYISGLFLLGFSIVLFFSARQLTIWGPFGPSSGFFPTILSALLAILSLSIIARAWFQAGGPQQIRKILGPNKKKFSFYLFSFFAFSLVFETVGYTLTLIGFLTFILKFVERQTWKTTVGIILICAVVSHFLFVEFLAVQLPEGPLSFILRRPN
jgi:hypothetical protein